MDYQIIREARLRWPFRPFFLKAKDGRVIYVEEAERFVVSSHIVVMIDAKTEEPHDFDPSDVESLIYPDNTEK